VAKPCALSAAQLREVVLMIRRTVGWTTMPDALAGHWLSALAAPLLTGLWLLERKLRRSHLS
jgi:hypothetical protein